MRYFYAILSGLLALTYGMLTRPVVPRSTLTPSSVVSASPAEAARNVAEADLRTSFHILPPSVRLLLYSLPPGFC